MTPLTTAPADDAGRRGRRAAARQRLPSTATTGARRHGVRGADAARRADRHRARRSWRPIAPPAAGPGRPGTPCALPATAATASPSCSRTRGAPTPEDVADPLARAETAAAGTRGGRARGLRAGRPRWSTCRARPACTPRRAEAWDERAGVCQDIAHLAVGALRSVGIPARYVSGYLHPARGRRGRRDRRRREPRLGRVVGGRLVRVGPHQRQVGRSRPRGGRPAVATTTTSRRCTASTRAPGAPSCSFRWGSPGSPDLRTGFVRLVLRLGQRSKALEVSRQRVASIAVCLEEAVQPVRSS